jgi:hypothetical protein
MNKFYLISILISFSFLRQVSAAPSNSLTSLKQSFPHVNEICLAGVERQLNKQTLTSNQKVYSACIREIRIRLKIKTKCEQELNGVYVYDDALQQSKCIKR